MKPNFFATRTHLQPLKRNTERRFKINFGEDLTTFPDEFNPDLKAKYIIYRGFPGGSVVKNPPTNAGDKGSIPGWGGSPGEENGKPLLYSCLENPMDRGAWRL